MAIENAKRDDNYVTTLQGVDMTTGLLPTRVYVDEATHRLLVSAVITAGAGADGAIVDGVSSSIKATVFDYTNANPLAVVLRDTNGDYVSVGGGTQYTEDAVAAGDPVGTVPILIRKDTPATTVTLDGDNIAQRGTNYGAAYVTLLDTGGTPVSVGGGTQYTEDAAAAADPIGNAVNLIRKDTPAAVTSLDGDNIAQRGTNYGAGYVQVVTSAGAFVDTFGGGTQYTEGDVDATITGTASMMEVAGNTLQPIQGTVADGLLVNLGTNNDITVTSGAITETNSAAIKTAVELIDNAVSGAGFNITQLGGVAVSMGTGVRDAGTQRVTIATNDAVPVTFTGSTDVATQTTLAAINAKLVTGTDIGDVTINNAAGASAVNIQDGGNIITVDGTITEANSASLLTSSQLLDDVVATLGTTTYTEAATKGSIIGAVRRDANTTLVDTTNEVAPLQVNATGELKVAQIQALPAGTNNIGDVDILSITAAAATNKVDVGLVNGEAVDVGAGTEAAAIRVTLPTNGTGILAGVTTVTAVTSLTQMNGAAISMNTGVRDAGTQRVTIATNDAVPVTFTGSTDVATQTTLASLLTSSQLIDDIIYTDDTSTHATGASKGALIMGAATPTDTAVNANDIGAIGMTNNRSMYVSVQDAIPAGTNNIGDVDVLTINGVAPAFGTGARGATVQRVTIATDDVVLAGQSGTWTVQPGNTPNTAPWLVTQTPKASGGLTTFHLVSAATTNATNLKASAGQVFGWFVYNSNAAARKLVFHNTAGTPTAGASVFFSIVIPPSAGANVEFTNGIAFSTGIAITTVTGLADTDSAAVALNDLVINVFYT